MRSPAIVIVTLSLGGLTSPSWTQNLLQNPRFDHDLLGWTASYSGPLQPRWSSNDAYGSAGSGSAIVDAYPGSSTLTQCVPVEPGASYDIGGTVLWGTTGGGQVYLTLRFHADTGCTSVIGDPSGLAPPGPSGGWTPLGLRLVTPRESQSASIALAAHSVPAPGPGHVPSDAFGMWDNLYLRPTAPPPPPTGFAPVTPCRLFDTRDVSGPTAGQGLPAGSDRLFAVVGLCGIPSNAVAAAMNITITRPDNIGDLRFYVRDVPLPLVSTINFGSGQTRANSAVVHLGSEGEIVVRSDQPAGTVHLILDVTGYFE